jgi:hypothetical protein
MGVSGWKGGKGDCILCMTWLELGVYASLVTGRIRAVAVFMNASFLSGLLLYCGSLFF